MPKRNIHKEIDWDAIQARVGKKIKDKIERTVLEGDWTWKDILGDHPGQHSEYIERAQYLGERAVDLTDETNVFNMEPFEEGDELVVISENGHFFFFKKNTLQNWFDRPDKKNQPSTDLLITNPITRNPITQDQIARFTYLSSHSSIKKRKRPRSSNRANNRTQKRPRLSIKLKGSLVKNNYN